MNIERVDGIFSLLPVIAIEFSERGRHLAIGWLVWLWIIDF